MCNWLITIVAVRLATGFDVAGILALAMSISNLVIPAAEYRLRTVHVTDIHNEHSSQEYLGMRIVSSVLALAAGIVYTLATIDTSAFAVIIVYTIGQLVGTYAEGYHAIEQRESRMDFVGISYILQGLGNLVGFVCGLYFFNSLLIAVTLVTATTVVVVIAYDLPRARFFGSIRPVIRWKKAFSTFAKLFPIAMVNAALAIVTLVPRQYLQDYEGTEALGIYASVAVLALIIQATAAYVYIPLLGHIVTQLNMSKTRGLRLIAMIVMMFFAVAALASIAFALFGDVLLSILFGAEILPHTYLIQPALILSVITAFVWFTNDLLLGLRNYVGCFAGGVAAAASTLALSAPLTRAFHLNGPSVVGIVASVVALAVMGFFFALSYRSLPSGGRV
ncbi:polysaccharide biosynthesis protein [Trueperella pecoris]|uniref:Polysaccharide biosynthesis protein n=1 Tax=Trueperella pecoris TaxID=2733571 RepID=A0A7M1QWB6_9ACTO|nr:polysaccharide biosynthesis protein [Trueperella pecoris]QOR46218.1 polysaccharide biosynthesis protein [Trueperella pecoris]